MIGWPDGLQVKPRMVGRCKTITSNILFFDLCRPTSMLWTESSVSWASLIKTYHQIDASKQYQIFVEGSQVLHRTFWGFVLCHLFFLCFFLGSLLWRKTRASATLPMLMFIGLGRRRGRGRGHKPRFFIRWWMTGGSGKRHKFFWTLDELRVKRCEIWLIRK